jgi:hypothetical protein
LAKNKWELWKSWDNLEIIWKHWEYWETQRFAKSAGQKHLETRRNPRNNLEISWKHWEYWETERFAKSVGQKHLKILEKIGNHSETLNIFGNSVLQNWLAKHIWKLGFGIWGNAAFCDHTEKRYHPLLNSFLGTDLGN